MPSKQISDSEKLYRAIYLMYWNFKLGSISYLAFRDPKGASVFRAGDRSQTKVISDIRAKFLRTSPKEKTLKAIASIQAGKCRNMDIFIHYNRSIKNNYHVEIWDSQQVKLLSVGKAYELAISAGVDFLDRKII